MYIIMGMKFNEKRDFGSIKMVEVKPMIEANQKRLRNYILLSKDKDKLNLITNCGSGSGAYCADTGELLVYEESERGWHKA